MLSKIHKYCKQHKFKVGLPLIAIIFGIPTAIYGHLYEWLHFYHDSVETLSFTAVIVSTIFVAYQIALFLKDYRQKRAHSEFETAYKLAGYYSKNIIPSLNAAQHHLRKINRLICKDYYKQASKFKDFTAAEAMSIFGPDVLVNFGKAFSDYKNLDYPEYEFFLNGTPTANSKKKIPDPPKPSKKNQQTISDREQFLREQAFLVNQHITYVLNDIEYFSMYFCSGLASSDTVYPSLHQTFLDFVIDSYLLICFMNSKPGHELYIHTTTLYNDWSIKSHSSHAKKQTAKKMPKE